VSKKEKGCCCVGKNLWCLWRCKKFERKLDEMAIRPGELGSGAQQTGKEYWGWSDRLQDVIMEVEVL
jgi:hypothetical protein